MPALKVNHPTLCRNVQAYSVAMGEGGEVS